MKKTSTIRRFPHGHRKWLIGSIVGLVILSFLTGCGPNDTVLRAGKETPPPTKVEDAQAVFAFDLESVRTANFAFILILRRKDGGAFDAADRSVIRKHTGDAGRRVSSDQERAFIIGSRAALKPEDVASLKARFSVEDVSPLPPSEPAANIEQAK